MSPTLFGVVASEECLDVTCCALVLFMTAPGLADNYEGLCRKRYSQRHDAMHLFNGNDRALGPLSVIHWPLATTMLTGAI